MISYRVVGLAKRAFSLEGAFGISSSGGVGDDMLEYLRRKGSTARYTNTGIEAAKSKVKQWERDLAEQGLYTVRMVAAELPAPVSWVNDCCYRGIVTPSMVPAPGANREYRVLTALQVERLRVERLRDDRGYKTGLGARSQEEGACLGS